MRRWKETIMLDTGYLFLCLLFAGMAFWMTNDWLLITINFCIVGAFVLYVAINLQEEVDDENE